MSILNMVPEKRKNRFIVLAILLTILLFEIVWLFGPGITGFVTYGEREQLIINKTYYNNTAESLDIYSAIESISISGQLIGNGSAIIWLEYNDTRVLIANITHRDKTIGSGNLITGLVIEDVSERDNTIEPISDNAERNLSLNFTENNTEQIITEINITQANDTIIEADESDFTDINITLSNTTISNSTEIEFTDINTTPTNTTESDLTDINTTPTNNTESDLTDINTTRVENVTNIEENITITPQITEFSNLCADSCRITDAIPPYRIVVELSDAALYIEEVKYAVSATPLLQTKPLPNITLDNNIRTFTINLSEYFIGENILYDISSIDAAYFSVSINGELMMLELADNAQQEIVDAFIYASSLGDVITSNSFTINILPESNKTNISIETIQYPAKLNEPVRWVKNITPEGNYPEYNTEISMLLPESSENITISKISKENDRFEEKIDKTQLQRQKDMQDNETTEDDSDDINKENADTTKKGPGADDNTLSVLSEAIQPEEISEGILIALDINASVDSVEVQYFTEAPVAEERMISEQSKEIIISSETHYKNVLSYANLPVETADIRWIKLSWIINSSENLSDMNLSEEDLDSITANGFLEKEIPFTTYDTNSNGLIDRIEWVAPHLSEQKFIIIVITKADLLDENRTYIDSIYNYVKEQDNITFNVSDRQYVRVTFERELTSANDITIYAHAESENATIKVYEQGKDEILAEFTNLTQEKYYKIYLTSLNRSEDTFDLYIINGTITIDHIIDPTPIHTWNMTLLTNYTDNNPFDSIEGARGMQFDYSRNLVIISSTTDDSFTILNYSNASSISVFGSINDSAPEGSVDNIWFGTLDSSRNLFYVPGRNDDTFSVYNVTSSTPVHLVSANAATANPGSLDGVYDITYVDIGTDRYAIASAAVSDTLSVYNVTDLSATPTVLFNRTTAANPCTTDDLRKLYNIPGTTLIIAASTTDDAISVFNISAGGTVSCVTNYSDNGPPNSIDGVQDFLYEESTKLLYVPGSVDHTMTILNFTTPWSYTILGSINDTTNLNAAVSVAVGTVGNDKFAFLGSTATGKGIRIVNVTDASNPKYYTIFNQTSGTCIYNAVYSLQVIGNMLYATSGTDSCFYRIKLYDISYIIPSNVTARISPASPSTASTLQGYCNATDDDNVYYNYIWYLNGSINTTGSTTGNYASGLEVNVANISASPLTVGHNWTFSCQANDTLNVSSWVNSSNVTIMNYLPTLLVHAVPAHDPLESSTRIIKFNFTVNDADGNATVNISSAIVTVNNSGIIRTSSGCSGTAINATAQNVSCNVSMQYYDPFGIWDINISIKDDYNNYVENVTTTFTYNELTAIQISSSNADVGAVNMGQQDIALTPIIINNTGNSIFVNLSIKAFDLKNSTQIISPTSFNVNVSNSSSGQSLINNTYINITDSMLMRNNDTTTYNKTLYIYLDVPPAPLTAGYYKSISEWILMANK